MVTWIMISVHCKPSKIRVHCCFLFHFGISLIFSPATVLTSKALAYALSLISKDTDQSSVMAAIDAMNQLLKAFKGGDLQDVEVIKQIATAVHDLFLEKVKIVPCDVFQCIISLFYSLKLCYMLQ